MAYCTIKTDGSDVQVSGGSFLRGHLHELIIRSGGDSVAVQFPNRARLEAFCEQHNFTCEAPND